MSTVERYKPDQVGAWRLTTDTRLVDGRDRRFGKLPQRIALQKARIGWRVRWWQEGLDGWDQLWRPTFRQAVLRRDALIGAAIFEGYVPAGAVEVDT